MKLRYLAMVSTFALVAPAFASPALAQRPQAGPSTAFQSRDTRQDFRDRDPYDRYNGRDSRSQSAFRDGYDAGARDARAHRRFSPSTALRFWSANRADNRGWNSRDQFANQFRDAFRDGYERGYDDAQRRSGWNSRWDGRR